MPILNPDHLLEQARRLIVAPPSGPPRQVDIRRAISAAYYGIFHTVLIAAADSVVGRVHRSSARYALVYRSIDHRNFKTVLGDILKSQVPPAYRALAPRDGFAPSIRTFAEAAVSLQVRRHAADYDPLPRFRTADAIVAIEMATAALKSWQDAPAEQRETVLWLLLFHAR